MMTVSFFVGCEEDQFICGNGWCIAISKECDDIVDCEDGSDEINCSGKHDYPEV